MKNLSYLGIVIIILWMLYSSFWQLYPFKVIDIKNSPYPVLNENKTVKRGENLIFHAEYCKYMESDSESTRQFIDGLVFNLPSSISSSPVGCFEQNVAIGVPHNLPEGEYVYRVTANYKVHPLRTIVVRAETERFKVTE